MAEVANPPYLLHKNDKHTPMNVSGNNWALRIPENHWTAPAGMGKTQATEHWAYLKI